MSDYQNDEKAERRAYKYRWYVILAVPALLVLDAIPWRAIAELVSGLHWWSFGSAVPL